MTSHAQAMREWIARHPRAFHLIEEARGPTAAVTVVETQTGKTLTFELPAVVASEAARDPIRGGQYLRVALDDGRSFVLSGLGFVFAPSFVNTGEVPDAPATACFMDFEKLLGHLSHLIDDHHEGHEREALATMTVLLSFLDGAAAIGLDVGAEERRLEKQLIRLEARGIA